MSTYLCKSGKRPPPPAGLKIASFIILIINKNTMPRVSAYLNFLRNTEEAFNFYKSVLEGILPKALTAFSKFPRKKISRRLCRPKKIW